MIGEHVGQVLDPLTRLPLQPAGGRTMPAGPGRTRDLPVSHVADEQVPEAVLGLPLHRAGSGRAHQLLARQLVQHQLHLVWVTPAHLGHGAGPEHFPHHRRVLEQTLAILAERVQARGDQRLHRGRHLHNLRKRAAVGEQAHELLRIQRVPTRPLQQLPLRLQR